MKVFILADKQALTILFIITLLFSFPCAVNSDCFGANCVFDLTNKINSTQSSAKILEVIDSEIRRVYWYYIDRAVLIYQFNFEMINSEFHYYFIYRNRIGTFLAVIARDPSSKQARISTFVRLSNGFNDGVLKTIPVPIQSHVISLKFSSQNLLLRDEQAKKAKEMEEVNNSTRIIDQYLRKTYWYYLDRSILLSSAPFRTPERLYISLNYMGIVGTFTALGSMDRTGKVQTNSLVRQGSGMAVQVNTPIVVQPMLQNKV